MVFFSCTKLQPYVDFGLKILGGDLMAMPGLYRFIQVNLDTMANCEILDQITYY